jgi:hypothetical protein
LTFSPEQIEAIYSVLSDIDAIKTAFKLTGKLPSQTINRVSQSVIVTSTGASNRIESNRLTDDEVATLYRTLRIREFKTRNEQEVAGYLEMLELIFESYMAMKLSVVVSNLVLIVSRQKITPELWSALFSILPRLI